MRPARAPARPPRRPPGRCGATETRPRSARPSRERHWRRPVPGRPYGSNRFPRAAAASPPRPRRCSFADPAARRPTAAKNLTTKTKNRSSCCNTRDRAPARPRPSWLFSVSLPPPTAVSHLTDPRAYAHVIREKKSQHPRPPHLFAPQLFPKKVAPALICLHLARDKRNKPKAWRRPSRARPRPPPRSGVLRTWRRRRPASSSPSNTKTQQRPLLPPPPPTTRQPPPPPRAFRSSSSSRRRPLHQAPLRPRLVVPLLLLPLVRSSSTTTTTPTTTTPTRARRSRRPPSRAS